VLEDVLAVARPVPKPAEQLDELLVHLPAVGLEDRLLARLVDVVLDLRLRTVVHLLDARGMDAPVLDELGERELRDLAAHAVERGEDDGLGRVVDDEVDAGEILEGADVPALAADDAALHVVGGQLDERDGRLGGMARRYALERVGDQVPRAPLRVGAGLFLHLPHHAGEVVADELFGALEHGPLGLLHRHAGDTLELLELGLLRLLHLVLQLLQVRLPVEETLLPPLELGQLAVDLLFLRDDALLDLDDLPALVPELLLDVGSELERLLARLDLGLAAHRLRRPLGLGEEPLPVALGRREPMREEKAGAEEGAEAKAHQDPQDQEADGNPHCSLLRGQARRNGPSKNRVRAAREAPRQRARTSPEVSSRPARGWSSLVSSLA
jgi:hypothetical protein